MFGLWGLSKSEQLGNKISEFPGQLIAQSKFCKGGMRVNTANSYGSFLSVSPLVSLSLVSDNEGEKNDDINEISSA